MTGTRVFHIANEFSVDARAVFDVLKMLGEQETRAEARLSDDTAAAVRQVFEVRRRHRETKVIKRKVEAAPETPRTAPITVQASKSTARTLERFQEEVRGLIPHLHQRLLELVEGVNPSRLPEVLVVYFNVDLDPRFGICDLWSERWAPPRGKISLERKLLKPLRSTTRYFAGASGRGPADSYYVAFDLAKGTAWHGQHIKGIRSSRKSQYAHVYADSLELVKLPEPENGPPRLSRFAKPVTPEKALALRSLLSDGADRPEEAFLIDESLLRLAVDSLEGAAVMAPVPVHVNAMWVFSRPVVMQRPDGSERHVGVLWFREGAAMWRLRTYTAGGSENEPSAKQVGEQLFGKRPFVPVWDETRPEQKLIAALWALMSQGDVSENERMEPAWRGVGRPVRNDEPSRSVTVVRVKAGTEHAAAYGRETGQGTSPHGTFSVRGHWRQQPYPSLGVDEEGHVVTKPVWIASYTKGVGEAAPGEKIIVVRA